MASSYTIKNNTADAQGEIESALASMLDRIGSAIEQHAKEYVPVRTGNLRDSITHVVDGRSVAVGTNVEYAAYVELGTSTQPARPYLIPAVTNHVDEIRAIATESLS